MRCWDEHFWWIIFVLVDYCTLPCQDRVSGHFDLRTDVAIYVITEQSLMPNVISVLSHWTNGVSDGLYCMVMTQHFILCYGYYCSYIDSCDMYWLVVSWSYSHIYMDLVVYCTMYWCPYLDLEVLDLYSLVLTLLRENRGSHSHHCFGLLVLAPSFIVFTHPFLPV